MHSRSLHFLFAAAVATALVGCEVPAAKETVTITLKSVSNGDFEPNSRVLSATAGLSETECGEGPCAGNPCEGDANGQTRCVGMDDQFVCQCPAGEHLEPDGLCYPDNSCTPSTCNDVGTCSRPEDGGTQCACPEGFLGDNCETCDTDAGWFADGLGSCSNDASKCRAGEGTEAFRAFIAAATEELGHGPSEIEITGARLTVVDGTAEGVRSWAYLWNEELALVVQSVTGFPHDAGVVTIPPAEDGLPPLEFDITLDRPTLSADPQFLAGDFRVGVRGVSDRQLTDDYSVDLQLELDFSAY